MSKKLFGKVFILLLVVGLLFAAAPTGQALAQTPTTIEVGVLEPSWDAVGGGGVWSQYLGPNASDVAVSPGVTAIYTGREAGIIKAGQALGTYWDEGLFAFKPSTTINNLMTSLSYDVITQVGVNPVWMTIEIDTGNVGDRIDNTTYQHVPTTNPAGWHTVDATAGLWQKWNNAEGDTTGNSLITSAELVTANTGLNVVRAYLRLGQGDSYYNGGTGTVAWVDKAIIGTVTYDFVVFPTVVVNETQLIAALADPAVTEIELGASFALTATVDVNRSVTIDGKGFTITGPSTYHAINVNGDDVTIKNLTITGTTNGHNLQFYRATGGVVTNVVLSNGGKSGMTVNGSQVTISHVTTSNNAWGGINVDQGSGVTEIPLLTVLDVTTHTSPAAYLTAAIWVDKGTATWVSVPAGSYTVVPGTPLSFFDTAEFAEAYPVHNVTQDTYFTTIQGAIDAAVNGDDIEVGPGTYNEAVIINKPNLTIESTGGAANTIIDVPDGTLTTGVKFLGTNLGVLTFDGFTVKDFTEGGIIQGMASGTGTTVHVLNNVVIPAADYLRNGIQVSGNGSTVIGNTVTGAHLTADWGGTGINVVNASDVIVRGNTINGSTDAAITVLNYNVALVSNVLIEDNVILGSDVAISLQGGPDATGKIVSNVTVRGNDLGASGEGIDIAYVTLTGANVFEKNDFSETPMYIGIFATGYPTWGYPGANVNGTIDASPNWYGTALGPDLAKFYDDQSGDTFSFVPSVYTPWCANAACTELLPAAVTIAPVAPVVCGVTPTTTIDINVAGIPTASPLQGYSFRLHFDPAMTSIAIPETDVVNGGFIANGGFLVTRWLNADGSPSTTATGILEVAYTQFLPSASIGDGKLASITLTHLGVAGDIALSVSDVVLSDRDGYVIPSEVSATATTLTLQPAVLNTTKSLGYCTLAEAVAGANPAGGDNLQLMADITIPTTVNVDKALTLDLNGKVATYSQTDNSYALTVNGTGAALTVVDGITPSTGKILVVDADADTTTEGRGISVINGSLTLNSGTIQAPYAGVYVRPGTSMVMNGGTIGGTVDPLYGIAVLGTGSSLDINGGVIEATYFAVTGNGAAGFGDTTITIDGGSLTSSTAAAIYHPQDGNITITAGTISGVNGIEMKAGNLSVTGGTILGTGAFADPLPNDNGSTETGDAILLNGRDAYTGDITVNITGGIITSTNAYALRDYKAADQALKTSSVVISGGEFRGSTVKEAVTFSDAFKAAELAGTANLALLPGSTYNTNPAAFVFVPYGTKLNTTTNMWEIVGISLNVDSFYYWKEGTIFLGVKADIGTTNFLFSEASLVKVELFSGTTGAYVLQQTNTLKVPGNFPGNGLTSPFNIFGTYVSSSWQTVRETEYGQHVAPTRVLVTVVLPSGTLYAESTILGNGTYTDIQPSIVISDFGYWLSGGIRGLSAGVGATNFNFNMATDIQLQLFSGTQLLQTNTAPIGSPLFNNGYTAISGPFDIFGTFDYTQDFWPGTGPTPNWTNQRQSEYGQTLVPTKVVATVTLPGNVILTAELSNPTGDRASILPGVNGLVTLQGILAPRAGVPVRLTAGAVVYNTTSTALSTINYGFTGVETLTYTFTTSQARYLNLTAASGKTFLVNGDKTLNPLRLYGGDVNQDNIIELLDASDVGSAWGSTLNPEANINYDGIVNIQDLALVGGNYGLTSATAYNAWSPLP
jgi:hypothetical protein